VPDLFYKRCEDISKMDNLKDTIETLKEYFSKRKEVLMAFVFGSYAEGRQMAESDFDVAVYFTPKNGEGPESDIYYENESEVYSDISRIIHKEIDLVCMNYAPASLVSYVIKKGIPLVIKDRKLHLETYLKASTETEDFLEFSEDFYRIYKKARSLTAEQKERLLVRLQFLDSEIKETADYQMVTFDDYREDKMKRRSIERWVENILNATIDIAKITLASEKRLMPRTYEEALLNFGSLAGLSEEEAIRISKFANLRNILAHEYLEILYGRIEKFIQEALPFYPKIIGFLENFVKR